MRMKEGEQEKKNGRKTSVQKRGVSGARFRNEEVGEYVSDLVLDVSDLLLAKSLSRKITLPTAATSCVVRQTAD